MNLVEESLAQQVIADRVADAERWRTGHRVLRASHLGRRAAKASVRAQRLSDRVAAARRESRFTS